MGEDMVFRIITKEKTNGDKAVTGMYLNIIQKAIQQLGITCEITSTVDGIDKSKDYIVCDECKVAFKYILQGYPNILIWIQGVVPEEALLKGYSRIRYLINSMIEWIVLKKSKFIFLCSNSMEDHYEHKYKLDLSDKSFIMPCFNEDDIDSRAFDENEKYRKNTFAYVGGLQEWQCFEQTVSIYSKIEKKSKDNTILYVYTAEEEKANEILKKHNIKNFKVAYKKQKELGSELNRIKYGFVLRKDIIVNEVATPTKLSNYISHGIIPIYSNCLRSFDNYNNESNGYGIACDLTNEKESIKKIENSMNSAIDNKAIKRWCSKTFSTYYGKDVYIKKISNRLRRLGISK